MADYECKVILIKDLRSQHPKDTRGFLYYDKDNKEYPYHFRGLGCEGCSITSSGKYCDGFTSKSHAFEFMSTANFRDPENDKDGSRFSNLIFD